MKYSEAERERQRRIEANAKRIAERGGESGVWEIPTRKIRGLVQPVRQQAAERE